MAIRCSCRSRRLPTERGHLGRGGALQNHILGGRQRGGFDEMRQLSWTVQLRCCRLELSQTCSETRCATTILSTDNRDENRRLKRGLAFADQSMERVALPICTPQGMVRRLISPLSRRLRATLSRVLMRSPPPRMTATLAAAKAPRPTDSILSVERAKPMREPVDRGEGHPEQRGRQQSARFSGRTVEHHHHCCCASTVFDGIDGKPDVLR